MGVALKHNVLGANHLANKLNILSTDLQSLNLKKFLKYSPFQQADIYKIPAFQSSSKGAQAIDLKDLSWLSAFIMDWSARRSTAHLIANSTCSAGSAKESCVDRKAASSLHLLLRIYFFFCIPLII